MKNPITGVKLKTSAALKSAFFDDSYRSIRYTLSTYDDFVEELAAYADDYDFFLPSTNTINKWWREHRVERYHHLREEGLSEF